MKKLSLLRFILLLTCAVTLSACVSSGFKAPNGAVTKPHTSTPAKAHKPTRARVTKPVNSQGGAAAYGISLNDFSDLNLPNEGDTRGNIWEKLAEGFKITNPESHPEVQQQIRWFLGHPDYLRRTTERARPYMYIVYNEVKKRGLPTELVLLPINESGYYPFSYSSAGATGIWQLMPGTASNFGLKRDFWYDGRRDIFDSTNAALDYLTYLANYFNNDWLLAIAAYDTGEGNVQNAIARNVRDGLPTDFWSLKLPAETRAYVPRLLAIAAIIEHPDRYPVPLPAIDDKPVVAQVRLTKQMNITDVARLSGLSVNQVKVLNPGLSRFATDPSLDAKVFLPLDSIDNFQQGMQATPALPVAPTMTRYKVARGDTVPAIANHFGVGVEALLQANNGLPGRLSIGQELWIPNASENFKPNAAINLDRTNLNIQAGNKAEVVAPEVQVPAVTTKKPSVEREKVVVKRAVVKNSANKNAAPQSKVKKIKVIAKAKDSFASVAARNHVSVKQLQQWNPSLAKRALKAGDSLVLIVPSN